MNLMMARSNNNLEQMDSMLDPTGKKGNQEDNSILKLINKSEFEAEVSRRTSKEEKDRNYLYCLVFPAEVEETGMVANCLDLFSKQDRTSQSDLDEKRYDILQAIEDAGMFTESVFSASRKEILVKIGANDQRLLKEAELKGHKLELNEFSVKHVLELGVAKIDPGANKDDRKPKNPVYLGYETYDEETFDEIQNQGGDGALPIYRKRHRRDFSTRMDLTDEPISLETAKESFLKQTKRSPYKYLHFEYDSEWEKDIVNQHKVQLYKTYNDGTILRTPDRIGLMQAALEREASARNGLRGAGLDLENLQFENHLLAHFPIQHSAQIRKAGDLSAEQIFRKFQYESSYSYIPPLFLPWKQPVQDVRDYCGEKIGYYFAFLQYYSLWLLYSALVGLCIFFVQLAKLKQETGEADIVTAPAQVNVFNLDDVSVEEFIEDLDFTNDRTPFAVSVDGLQVLLIKTPTEIPYVIAIYSILIAFWATFFLEFWKRKQATLAFKWGVSDYERHAAVRPEFKSSYDVPDAVTGLPTPYRSNVTLAMRLAASFSFVGFLVGCTIAAFAATYVFKAFMSQNDTLDATVAVQVALVLNGVAITGLGIAFKSIGKMLTDWENHRTDIEYEDQLIGKIFVFSFFNSYTTLIYFAFLKSGSELLEQNQYCVAELEDFEFREETEDGFDEELNQNFLAEDLFKVDTCYGALGYSLIIIFATQILFNNFLEIGVPYLTQKYTQYQNRNKAREVRRNPEKFNPSKREHSKNRDGTEEKVEEDRYKVDDNTELKLRSPTEIQFLLDPYDTPFHDYLELALQYGYVTLFVAAFPLAPFLALLNNFVEVWVDAKKICIISRRPMVKKAQDIGTWLYIFEILGYIAVVTNSAVIIFTSVELFPIGVESDEDKVWTFLIFIVFIFSVKYFADFFIPDTPESIKLMLRRQAYIKQKIFFDSEDDIDKMVMTKEQYKKAKKIDAKGADGMPVKDEELSAKMMKYQPSNTDPYMSEILEEIKGLMKEGKVKKAELFGMIDTDNNEVISLAEFQRALLHEEIGIGNAADPEIVKLFVGALDLNNDGHVTREELDAFLGTVMDEGSETV